MSRRPIDKKARAHADKVAARYPDFHAAWGVAYDSYREGSTDVVIDPSMIDDEIRANIARLLKHKYTSSAIARSTGVEYHLVLQVVKGLKAQEKIDNE